MKLSPNTQNISDRNPKKEQLSETQAFFNDLDLMLKGKKVNSQESAILPCSRLQCMYVLNFKTRELISSVGVEAMLGYTPEEFDFNSLVNYVHPDDVDMLTSVRHAVLDHLAHHQEIQELTLSITYRIRKKNGQYIKVLKQMSIARHKYDPQTIYYSNVLTDISFMKSAPQVEWAFDAPNMNAEQINMYVPPNNAGFFSAREQEVLELIDKGYKSHEIAKALFISKHTVDTHRRKMLQKTGCPNAIALLEFYRSNAM